MGWSYNRLWIFLINNNIKRSELRKIDGISNDTVAKIVKNMPVTMTVLGHICEALHCGVEDIVEYIPDSPSEQSK